MEGMIGCDNCMKLSAFEAINFMIPAFGKSSLLSGCHSISSRLLENYARKQENGGCRGWSFI